MIYVHLGSPYHVRETGAWVRQQDAETRDDCEARDYFAGYCLDALLLIPAGSMERLEPQDREPFAVPRFSLRP